jgi:hypothetical protein
MVVSHDGDDLDTTSIFTSKQECLEYCESTSGCSGVTFVQSKGDQDMDDTMCAALLTGPEHATLEKVYMAAEETEGEDHTVHNEMDHLSFTSLTICEPSTHDHAHMHLLPNATSLMQGLYTHSHPHSHPHSHGSVDT